MKKNKINCVSQTALRDKIERLQSTQTYTKTRNIKHLNVKARFTKEFLDNYGWNQKEFLILDYYESVKIVNGKEMSVSECATFEVDYTPKELKKIPWKYIEIV